VKLIFHIKQIARKLLPKTYLILYRLRRYPQDIRRLLVFPFKKGMKASLFHKIFMIKKIFQVSSHVQCPHTEDEMISVIESILSLSSGLEGCIVEAGSYKGGSAAKFSIAAKMMNKQLIVFDSFEGMPRNEERLSGGQIQHAQGLWRGSLEEVKNNVKKYGAIEVCEFIKGWFADTMPTFHRPIAVIYLDVDLVSSTRTCLKHLYPLLACGGVLYSQDGHLSRVVDLYNDDDFWRIEMGCPKPIIEGLGKRKLIKIVKPY